MHCQSAGVRPWLEPHVFYLNFEFSPTRITVKVRLLVLTVLLMHLAHFVLSVYVHRTVFLNTSFIFHGRWYYIVVVPMSPVTRKWKNPDEMDMDEVSASPCLIG